MTFILESIISELIWVFPLGGIYFWFWFFSFNAYRDFPNKKSEFLKYSKKTIYIIIVTLVVFGLLDFALLPDFSNNTGISISGFLLTLGIFISIIVLFSRVRSAFREAKKFLEEEEEEDSLSEI